MDSTHGEGQGQPGSHHSPHHQPHAPHGHFDEHPPNNEAPRPSTEPLGQSNTNEPSSPQTTGFAQQFSTSTFASPANNPPKLEQSLSSASPDPIAVVQNVSVRGLEYWVMFIALWVSAFALEALATSLISRLMRGDSAGEAAEVANLFAGTLDAFALSFLIIFFPAFLLLFMRLKKAEASNPALKLDPSRRRFSQFTQIIAFVGALGGLSFSVYTLIGDPLFASFGEAAGEPTMAVVVNMVISFATFASIFWYYWREDHK